MKDIHPVKNSFY